MKTELSDNDRQRIYKEVNRIFNESESVDLVHELMFKVGEYATIYERDKRKLWNDENNNLIKELGRRDGKIQQLEAERSELRTIEDVVKAFEAGKLAGQSELRNKVIEQQGKIDALTDFLKTIRPYVGQISIPHGSLFLKEIKQLLNSLKTK